MHMKIRKMFIRMQGTFIRIKKLYVKNLGTFTTIRNPYTIPQTVGTLTLLLFLLSQTVLGTVTVVNPRTNTPPGNSGAATAELMFSSSAARKVTRVTT